MNETDIQKLLQEANDNVPRLSFEEANIIIVGSYAVAEERQKKKDKIQTKGTVTVKSVSYTHLTLPTKA